MHQRVHVGCGAFVAAAAVLLDDLIPYGLAAGAGRATVDNLNLRWLRRQRAPATEQRAMLRAFRALFDLPSRSRFDRAMLRHGGTVLEQGRVDTLAAFDNAGCVQGVVRERAAELLKHTVGASRASPGFDDVSDGRAPWSNVSAVGMGRHDALNAMGAAMPRLQEMLRFVSDESRLRGLCMPSKRAAALRDAT